MLHDLGTVSYSHLDVYKRQVTHSSLAASHARRVLFIRDGKLFAELCRGDQSQQVFYDRITASLSMATRQDGESL